VVVDAEVEENNEDTFRSERSSALKKNLTGPTLLEMSGFRANQELPTQRTVLRNPRWNGCLNSPLTRHF
jgi:hypothetical protein